ncbi:hypothetical protein ENSA7_23520 [Enhygromyxa salina]|uniref:Uncharacterized protein n=1 Tax=Enhygromyxa salina TaxID=215803 RepID=A0A2S9YS39_9BACT|nr:hypothetical protein ENSA7_23520 [Enhygromyxa salina]
MTSGGHIVIVAVIIIVIRSVRVIIDSRHESPNTVLIFGGAAAVCDLPSLRLDRTSAAVAADAGGSERVRASARAGNGGEARSILREPDRPYGVVAGEALSFYGATSTDEISVIRHDARP